MITTMPEQMVCIADTLPQCRMRFICLQAFLNSDLHWEMDVFVKCSVYRRFDIDKSLLKARAVVHTSFGMYD